MNRELMTLVATLGLTAAATASPVGVYINDDFSTTLNTTIWSNYSSPATAVTVANSKLNGANNPTGDWVFANSPNAVHPDAGQTVVLSSSSMELGGYPVSDNWGLTDNGSNSINLRQFRTGLNPSDYYVGVQISTSLGVQYLTLSTQTYQITGGWDISWTPTQVKITNTILGTVFDSTVQTLDGSSNAWVLPTANMTPMVKAYYGGFWFDNMKLEVIPEPASALLLGLALAGLWGRKRR